MEPAYFNPLSLNDLKQLMNIYNEIVKYKLEEY